MSDKNKFCFICTGNREKVVNSWFTPETTLGMDTENSKPLGTCFCALLNSLEDLKNFKKEFNSNVNNYIISNDFSKSVISVYNKITNISEYFRITRFAFKKCTSKINKNISNNDFTSIYVKEINDILKHIIDSIEYAKYDIKEREHKFLIFPTTFIRYNYNKKKFLEIQYTYIVQDIIELLRVSYYQLILNKIYIKQCKYPNCHKYFVSSRGQTRYCENSCPDNQTKTCRSIRKTIDRNTEKQESWEKQFDELEKKLNKIRTRFYDNIHKKSINTKEKEIINNNYIKLKKIVSELKRYIKGNTGNKREYYLKIYAEFLNEVENNLNLSPSVFKIKKPKY